MKRIYLYVYIVFAITKGFLFLICISENIEIDYFFYFKGFKTIIYL